MSDSLFVCLLLLLLFVLCQNAFIAMYLISCFTQLNDWASNVSDMAGYTHRCGKTKFTFTVSMSNYPTGPGVSSVFTSRLIFSSLRLQS